MKKINFIIYFLAFGLLAGCGFHLRGSQDLSAMLPEVQLTGINPHSELGRDLVRSLAEAKVRVVEDSTTILHITQNRVSKRVVSVDSAGRANQYELNYQLGFTLQEKVQKEEQGEQKQYLVELVKPQTINEKREYLFDANLVLAKSSEELKLHRDMRQSAILQLLRRLNYSLKSRNKTDSMAQ